MREHRLLVAVLLATALGCTPADEPARKHDARGSSGHGYAILHEILGQERQVAKLLLVKLERDELETVIDAIAKTCDEAYDRLEKFAKADRGLDLVDTGLPRDEVQTRQAMAATWRERLLAASGRELEFQLLLSQHESLAYMAHLADTLSRSEPDPERLAFLRGLWTDLTRRQEEVLALMRRPAARGERP